MASAVHLRSAIALVGRFPVLAGVNLDVEIGEVVLLEGPNGAGKTSLLRVCAGLLAVTEGEAEVLGHDLRVDRRSVRTQVGLLGHHSAIYDDLTVEENMRFTLGAARVPMKVCDESLVRFGLDGRVRHARVSSLSAGQRRRVALACLVAKSPRLWLLDEPHAGLDAPSRDLVDKSVLEAAANGATVLVASHEVGRASALANRVATIAGGQVHECRSLEAQAITPEGEPAHVA